MIFCYSLMKLEDLPPLVLPIRNSATASMHASSALTIQILDSPLMLSIHVKGSRHVAAASKLKDRESSIQEEIKKRIALSSDSADIVSYSSSTGHIKSSSKPLTEQTQKAVFGALHEPNAELNVSNCGNGAMFNGSTSFFKSNSQSDPNQEMKPTASVRSGLCHGSEKSSKKEKKIELMIADQHARMESPDQHAPMEGELKFTSAGWKRDCHGKWFCDENVEFDSDEEDPNVCLS